MRPADPQGRIPFGARCAIAVLVALLSSLVWLMLSERIGRLSMDLQYDDVSYAVDAADRVDVLRNQGIATFVKGFVAGPPHSPYSCLVAMAAFMTLGFHDLSLYLGNAIVMVCAALFLVLVTRRRDDGTLFVALVLVFVSALAYHTTVEFRPDPAYGLAMAAMATTFVTAALDARPRRAWIAGLLLAACLLLKTSFFPHTLAIALLLAALSAFASWKRAPAAVRVLALPPGAIAAFLLIGIVVAAPYYAIAWEQTVGYFWKNTFGTLGKVHNFDQRLTAWQTLKLFGPYVFDFSRFHFYATLIAATGFTAVAYAQGRTREAILPAVLTVAGLASTAIIIAGRQPSAFFFTTANWMFFTAAIVSYGIVVAHWAPAMRRFAHAATAVGLAILAMHSLDYLREAWPPGASHLASENVKIVAQIRGDLDRTRARRRDLPIAFVGTAGPVNSLTLKWVARLNGVRIHSWEPQYVLEYEKLIEWASNADYVVLVKPDRAPFDRWLPLSAFQARLLQWAQSSQDLALLTANADEASYLVFANRHTMTPQPAASAGPSAPR